MKSTSENLNQYNLKKMKTKTGTIKPKEVGASGEREGTTGGRLGVHSWCSPQFILPSVTGAMLSLCRRENKLSELRHLPSVILIPVPLEHVFPLGHNHREGTVLPLASFT